MQIELAIKLCNSAVLSSSMQKKLWALNDERVRERLVSRGDLDLSIEEDALKDDKLISYWAKAVREPYKLELACLYASSENTILSIISNRDLPVRSLEILLSKATSNIAWEILKISSINKEIRLKALEIFNKDASLTTANFGEALLDTFGYDIENWIQALKSSTWANSGIILQSARYYKESPEIEEILLIKFKELDNFIKLNKITLSDNTPLNRDILKIWEALLANYNISNYELALFQHNDFVVENSEFSRLLKNRLSFDFKSAISDLDCSIKEYLTGDEGFEHAKNIEALLTLGDKSNLNSLQIAREALLHSDKIEVAIFKKAFHNLSRSELSKFYYEVVKTLDFNKSNSFMLENFLKEKGIMGLKSSELKLSKRRISTILLFLASIGHRDINENNLTKSQIRTVFKKIEPVRLNLEQPEFSALLLKTLEKLKTDEREFAFTLLNHWDGDLESLIQASKKINSK